jgi:hypothetical protein
MSADNWTELATARREEPDGPGWFWIVALRREEHRVNAACRALGALEFLVGPEFTGTTRNRLASIGEVVAELRDELGMPPGPVLASATESTSTSETASDGEAA